MLLDTNDSQPSGAVLNTLTYTPGVSQNVNGVDSFFHTDWLGSTRYLSDATGNSFPAAQRYTAFGEVSSPLALQPPSYYQFAGDWGYQSEWSASYEPGLGLQYLEQRYYDPAIGRFLSRDPIGFRAGLHPYLYGTNDPVNTVDPLGLQSVQAHFLVALGAGNIAEAVNTLETTDLEEFEDLTGRLISNGQVQRLLTQAVRNVPRLPASVTPPGYTRLPMCEQFARATLSALQKIGVEKAEVLEIVPTSPSAGALPVQQGGFFFRHFVVRYGNTIVDSLTGVRGQQFSEWVNRWKYGGPHFAEVYKLIPPRP